MEQYRDVGKSAKQAKPIQDLVASFRHDHMHMEDGVLVEDIPDDGEEQMRLAKAANRILANYKGGFDARGEYHHPEPVPDVAGRDLGGVALAQFSDMGEFYDDFGVS